MSDLQDFLFALKSRHSEEHLKNVLKIQKLCDSIAGNPCYILTITTDVNKNDIDLTKQASKNVKKKKESGMGFGSSPQVSTTKDSNMPTNAQQISNANGTDEGQANQENFSTLPAGNEGGDNVEK